MHGDGHGMPDDTSEYAYRWLERWIKQPADAAKLG
jgi:hypothetical protein